MLLRDSNGGRSEISLAKTEINCSFSLACFSGTDCDAPFSCEEVQKFLDPASFRLYLRIRAMADSEKANICLLLELSLETIFKSETRLDISRDKLAQL